MKSIVFDIMVGDRFYKTMRMPITLDVIAGYAGEVPIYDIKKIEEWVLQKCPTLKYDDFTIHF